MFRHTTIKSGEVASTWGLKCTKNRWLIYVWIPAVDDPQPNGSKCYCWFYRDDVEELLRIFPWLKELVGEIEG